MLFDLVVFVRKLFDNLKVVVVSGAMKLGGSSIFCHQILYLLFQYFDFPGQGLVFGGNLVEGVSQLLVLIEQCFILGSQFLVDVAYFVSPPSFLVQGILVGYDKLLLLDGKSINLTR